MWLATERKITKKIQNRAEREQRFHTKRHKFLVVRYLYCLNSQASYIVETGRNLYTRLTEHKLAARNGDANNHIAVHHQLTNHNID